MGGKRRVRCSSFLLDHARAEFPPGGDGAGGPSFEHFRDGPLAAATEFFRRRFEEAPEVVPGVRCWVTIAVPLFPPMAFYAAEVADHTEILDYTSHDPEEYWSMVEDDPV